MCVVEDKIRIVDLKPLPHDNTHLVDPNKVVIHYHPYYVLQVESHPSPEKVFPSSHYSWNWLSVWPLPQSLKHPKKLQSHPG